MAETVMQRLVGDIRKAYLSPAVRFILIDTDEVDIVRRAIIEGSKTQKLVDLLEEVNEDYYERLRLAESPDFHGEYSNLYTSYVVDVCGEESSMSKIVLNFLEARPVSSGSGNESRGTPVFMIPITSIGKNMDPKLCRELREYICTMVAIPFEEYKPLVILYGDISIVPRDISTYSRVVEIKYPETWEIADMIYEHIKKSGIKGSEDFEKKDVHPLDMELAGLTFMDAEHLIDEMINADYPEKIPLIFDNDRRTERVREFKNQTLLKGGGILQLVNIEDHKIAGLGEFQRWARAMKEREIKESDYKVSHGVSAARGVFLVGPPGTGKSTVAELLGEIWKGMPLIKLNMSEVLGRYVGDSEKNMEKALEQAEAMAPCILWIDEIDKSFSGASEKGGEENATFKRVFGVFLTWLQSRKRNVFVYATANDISPLPPEFMRSERFDAMFSVFMPTCEECIEIFKLKMLEADKLRKSEAKLRGNAEKVVDLFDGNCYANNGCLATIMDLLANKKKFVVGADIKKIVDLALMQDIGTIMRPDRSISADEWKERVQNVIDSSTLSTQGGSEASRNQIASNYVKLLRGNFVSASDKKEVMFRSDEYVININRKDMTVSTVCNFSYTANSVYDKAMFDDFKNRIEILAPAIERNKLLKDIE